MKWTFEFIINDVVFTGNEICSREQADAIAEDIMYRIHRSVDYYQTGLKLETILTAEYE